MTEKKAEEKKTYQTEREEARINMIAQAIMAGLETPEEWGYTKDQIANIIKCELEKKLRYKVEEGQIIETLLREGLSGVVAWY